MNRIILASNNAGKLCELAQMLEPLRLEVVPQSALGIQEVEEPYQTFVENALAKARHAARYANLPALADDSGVCVAALRGEPGVHSARFAGEPKSDRRNNEKLISLLRGHADRRAHYYCAVVLVRHADDPEPLIAEGRWYGEIVDVAQGEGGFGYDPHFFIPALRCTVAELKPAQKHEFSHRGQALRRLTVLLSEAR